MLIIEWTLLKMQSKVVGKAGFAGNFSGYDEYVPMVDKAVDAGWKKQSLQQSLSMKGPSSTPTICLFF